MTVVLGHTLSAMRHMPQAVPALHWGVVRGPQSVQSVPRTQNENSAPGPPSSQSLSEAKLHVSAQVVRVAPKGGPAGGGGAGGRGGGGNSGGGGGIEGGEGGGGGGLGGEGGEEGGSG